MACVGDLLSLERVDPAVGMRYMQWHCLGSHRDLHQFMSRDFDCGISRPCRPRIPASVTLRSWSAAETVVVGAAVMQAIVQVDGWDNGW